ncbi:MAG TPA: HAMP domain-containing protein, partial [Rhodospirillales bacterium]|nr:HAMP domain-containing protein [Rhodospirillales bacterium]
MLNIKIQTIGMIIAFLLAIATGGVVYNSTLTVKQVTMMGQTWKDFEEGPEKKMGYINDLYNAIGFGGMVHKYKDFILEAKRTQLVAFNAKVREAVVALSNYKRVGVNEEEETALKAIQGVLKSYIEASQKAEQLSAGGASSAEIVTKVTIDDTPALKGVETLSSVIAKSSRESANAVNQAVTTVTSFVQTMTVVVGLILATMVVSMFWFTRYRLGRPMMNMTQAMKKLANGDLSIEVPARERKDEIGEMAQTVQVFKENAMEMRRMESEQAAMRERSEKEKKEMLNKLADDLENNVGAVMNELFEGASDIVATAEKLGSKMDTSSSRSLDVAGASGRTSTNVHTLASATEQLSTSINEISQQVAQSSQITSSAVNQAQNTNEQVQGLAFAAEKVGEVVDLIADIAEQTNILALN